MASGLIDPAPLLKLEFGPEVEKSPCTPGLAIESVVLLCGRTGNPLVPSTIPLGIDVGNGGAKGAGGGLFPSCRDADSAAGMLGLLITASSGLEGPSEKYCTGLVSYSFSSSFLHLLLNRVPHKSLGVT